MRKFYITTPIYYVNDKPHIGHAYTSLACDVLARFKKHDGYDSYLLTGTDEHGQKIEQSAQKNGITPQELTDKFSLKFKELMNYMNISYQDFIRTTEARHITGAKAFWKALQKNNAIYKDKYEGWYAVRDECFYTKEQVEDKDGNKVSKATGAPVEWLEEESYFFRLSDYQDKLLQFYEENPDVITPKSRKNEVVSFVKSGLRDISISRTAFKWGIPIDDDPDHIMYVWVDALTNYITALGYPNIEGKFADYWSADIHMVGKDILTFHAIYWPALLMAAKLPLPKRIFAHGWWTNEGQKISKSVGNVIDPLELVEKYGLDQTRYFLMREISFGQDGDFSHHAIIRRSNSDLANDLGNLCQRSLTMLFKNCDAKISNFGENIEDKEILTQKDNLLCEMRDSIENQEIHIALASLMKLASSANQYIDKMQPWALKKTNPVRMQEVLSVIAEIIRNLGILAQPFMPDSAAKMLDILNIPETERDFNALATKLTAGHRINQPEIIFNRLEE